MTNELEKQFFQCFGIEPNTRYRCTAPQPCAHTGYHCKGCTHHSPDSIYPQITDRILLELICILTEWRQYCASDYIIKAININILKNDILKDCLYMSNWYEFKKCGKDIKHQVQALFGQIDSSKSTGSKSKRESEMENKCQCTCEECGDVCNPFWKKSGDNDR